MTSLYLLQNKNIARLPVRFRRLLLVCWCVGVKNRLQFIYLYSVGFWLVGASSYIVFAKDLIAKLSYTPLCLTRYLAPTTICSSLYSVAYSQEQPLGTHIFMLVKKMSLIILVLLTKATQKHVRIYEILRMLDYRQSVYQYVYVLAIRVSKWATSALITLCEEYWFHVCLLD